MNHEAGDRTERRFIQVQQYIINNIDADLSAVNVATKFSISVSTLFHLFAKYSPQTYKEFIIAQRMEKALHLLLTTRLSVKEIITAVGYNDRSSFNKCFKKTFHKPPLNFREPL